LTLRQIPDLHSFAWRKCIIDIAVHVGSYVDPEDKLGPIL